MRIYPLTMLYEGTCPLCKLEIDNLRTRNQKGLLRFVDVSAPDFDPAPYSVPLSDMLEAVHAESGWRDGKGRRGIQACLWRSRLGMAGGAYRLALARSVVRPWLCPSRTQSSSSVGQVRVAVEWHRGPAGSATQQAMQGRSLRTVRGRS